MPSLKRRDLRLSILIKSPAEPIYKALTSARQLCGWWADRAETEAKNGGRLRLEFPPVLPGETARELRGCFVDLDPGNKVAWLLGSRSRRPGEPALMTFFIEPYGRYRRVTVLHAGFPESKSFDKRFEEWRVWWQDCLAKLCLYLEKGEVHKGARLLWNRPKTAAGAR